MANNLLFSFLICGQRRKCRGNSAVNHTIAELWAWQTKRQPYIELAPLLGGCSLYAELYAYKNRQFDWLIELFDDTPSNMMRKQSSYRGYIPGYKYAEGFRQVLTYPLVGSYKLLP